MEEEEKEERKNGKAAYALHSFDSSSRRAIDQGTKNKRQYQVLYLCTALEAL
jgi:hypothetical protein